MVSPRHQRLALYLRVAARSLNGLDVRTFCQALLRHLRRAVVLVWDRGTIHRRREVQVYLAHRARVHPYFFPAYAPELNPAEHIWSQADSALANGVPQDLEELRGRLRCTVRRLRGSQPLLWACIGASKLPWTR